MTALKRAEARPGPERGVYAASSSDSIRVMSNFMRVYSSQPLRMIR